MVVRYESIRGELGLPSLQELWQNCFGVPEKGAECKIRRRARTFLFVQSIFSMRYAEYDCPFICIDIKYGHTNHHKD
jgi:hypothetical protein